MKRIVLASGGLDSSALLTILPKEDTVALFYDYGQACVKQERKSLEKVTEKLGIPMLEIDIVEVFKRSNSSIVNGGENKHEVESRNLVFIANAISVAMQLFPQEKVDVLLGLIKIRMPYPDCTIDFIRRCNDLAQMVSNGCVQISAPFADIGKDDVLMRLKDSQILPKETWSCYYGKEEPCGKCPACIDRKILEV